MKPLLPMLTLATAALTLGGCVVSDRDYYYDDGYRDGHRSDRYDRYDRDYDRDDDYRHCPPGHRKKGWC